MTNRLNPLFDYLSGLPGTAVMRAGVPPGWWTLDARTVDTPGRLDPLPDPDTEAEVPPARESPSGGSPASNAPSQAAPVGQPVRFVPRSVARIDRSRTVIRLPDLEAVKQDPVLYAHAARVVHAETNPGNARPLVQRHGDRDVWLNPPAEPLTPRDGSHRRMTLSPRTPFRLWRGAHPRLRDDPLLGHHHAGLLRGLHLLFDYRA